MNTIQFSHYYEKFTFSRINEVGPGPPIATLLQVFEISYKRLSKEFIKYDTEYGLGHHYKLPETKLTVLLFQNAYNGNLFTTIRRYTPKKIEYYQNKMGENFEIIIKEIK